MDATLTDTGVGQYGAIYRSPLRRCPQTLLAALPKSRWFVPIIVDDRLMEPQEHTCNCRADRAAIAEEVPNWNLTGVADVNSYNGTNINTSFHRRIIEFTNDLRLCAEEEEISKILVVSDYEWIRLWFAIFQQKEVSPRNCQLLTAKI
jgi:hypothetical protein